MSITSSTISNSSNLHLTPQPPSGGDSSGVSMGFKRGGVVLSTPDLSNVSPMHVNSVGARAAASSDDGNGRISRAELASIKGGNSCFVHADVKVDTFDR